MLVISIRLLAISLLNISYCTMKCTFHKKKLRKKSSFSFSSEHTRSGSRTHHVEASNIMSLCPADSHWCMLHFNLRISLHDRSVSQKHDILLDFYLYLLLTHNKHYLLPKRYKELQTEDFSLDKWSQCSQAPSGKNPQLATLNHSSSKVARSINLDLKKILHESWDMKGAIFALFWLSKNVFLLQLSFYHFLHLISLMTCRTPSLGIQLLANDNWLSSLRFSLALQCPGSTLSPVMRQSNFLTFHVCEQLFLPVLLSKFSV